MKHEKKYEIMGLLDDRIYEEVLHKRDALSRGSVIRNGNRFRRILLLAACVAVLAAGVTAAFLPAMLREEPHETEDTEALTPAPTPAVDWVWDSTMVRVERLSSPDQDFADSSANESSFVPDSHMTTANITVGSPGRRLILIRFSCREGERVTVTPSQRGAVSVAVRKEGADGRPIWYRVDQTDGRERYAEEILSHRPSTNYPQGETVLLGSSLTVSGETALLWQYSDEGIPCAEDNFVDFTVTDRDGQITGGGSVYVGGLDLIPLTENKTYYSEADARFNAIYRPYVLGAYRCDALSAEQTDVDALQAELHARAEGVRDELFRDLNADSFKLSMRKLKHEQSEAFVVLGEDGSMEITVRMLAYRSDDRYALVMNHDGSNTFFLYDGTYQRIEATETDTVGEHGVMLQGRYILTDGTVVHVDFLEDILFKLTPPSP